LTLRENRATLLSGRSMTSARRAIWYFIARVSLVALVGPILLPASHAQNAGDTLNGTGSHRDLVATARSYGSAPNTAVLIFKVFAERRGHQLDRQAVLKLVNLATQSPTWQTTEMESQGPYPESASEGVFTNVPYGSYDVEISAVGYLSTHKDLNVSDSQTQQNVEIVLHRDPSATSLDLADNMLPGKTRKEAKLAVSELKSGKLDEARKHLDKAYSSSPASANINFLLGYLYFQKKDFTQATKYLTAATALDPHNAPAFTLLGRAGLESRDYPSARSALEQAVLADPDSWLPHNLLADAYLHEKNYAEARDEAQIAITKGKNAASPAQLVLGEALVNLGQPGEEVRALKVFLDQSPRHPVAGQVLELIADLENGASTFRAPDNETQPALKPTGVDPLTALPAPKFSMKARQPPGIDEIKLSVAPDVACPAERVIEESGKRVQELVDDVAKFAAIEDLLHQTLDEYGNPVRTETRKFDYVASISEVEPGYLAVEEYRSEKLSVSDYPGKIASTGFAALALVFHPHIRETFDIGCEGLGDWHGQASWLVRFRQRNDRPNRMHSYKVGNQLHPVALKGRAWITSDKFQIVRIEAEMVTPMPEIQLLSEHQVVEYGPIPFPKKNTTLWLPKSADIYFDFRKHRYYRRHSFDHYMLYSVDTKEKRKEPGSPPAKREGS
jgi:tetratricopeptide (TPR) repeat protein